jgi:hypothetical protein
VRFLFVLKGDPGTGRPPGEPTAASMGAYVGQLVRAGVLLAAEGLDPGSHTARIRFAEGGPPVVTESPGNADDDIRGYILVEVRSMAEAIEWASRCPVEVVVGDGEAAEIEVRPVVALAAAG